jgi:pimeloyl-ACP methyl ester carboxylesterase
MKKTTLSQIATAAIGAALMFAPPAHANAPANCAVEGSIARTASEGQSDRITVELAGKEDGPDVVLIPGLSTPRDVWDDTVRALAGCYRLHLVQVRGFGDAPGANAEGPVLDPLVKHVADYIDDAIFDAGRGKPKIIGHSFGGLTAMKVGLAIPEKVGGIMVVDSLPFFGVLFGPTVTAEQMKPQAAGIRTAMQAATQPGLDAVSLKAMSRTQSGQAMVSKWVAVGNPKVAGQVFYEVMTTDIREELKTNQVPITMLYPINPDSPFPADLTENNYKASYTPVPNATLVRVDDSAHFIMLDQPEKFLASVTAFLADEGKEAVATR